MRSIMTTRIHAAAGAFDVELLRRELDAGVDPDLMDMTECTPMIDVLIFRVATDKGENVNKRIACLKMLLEAGASPNMEVLETRPLACVAPTHADQGTFHEQAVDVLLRAGADVNLACHRESSILRLAAKLSSPAIVAKLISAGALDLAGALDGAITFGRYANCCPLLRAGAPLPHYLPADGTNCRFFIYSSAQFTFDYSRTCAYVKKVTAAGGFKAYEKAHRQRLTTMFAPKFPRVPIEVISHIVLLWAHVGDY